MRIQCQKCEEGFRLNKLNVLCDECHAGIIKDFDEPLNDPSKWDGRMQFEKPPKWNDWISCAKRLPEPQEDVLITNGKKIYIGWIIIFGKQSAPHWVSSMPEHTENEVTHWMSLPELPK